MNAEDGHYFLRVLTLHALFAAINEGNLTARLRGVAPDITIPLDPFSQQKIVIVWDVVSAKDVVNRTPTRLPVMCTRYTEYTSRPTSSSSRSSSSPARSTGRATANGVARSTRSARGVSEAFIGRHTQSRWTATF